MHMISSSQGHASGSGSSGENPGALSPEPPLFIVFLLPYLSNTQVSAPWTGVILTVLTFIPAQWKGTREVLWAKISPPPS